MVTCVFDMRCTTVSGSVVAVGVLNVGGVTQGESANFLPTANNQRACVSQTFKVQLSTVGTYVFKMRASQNSAGGSYSALTPHTKMTAILVETA